MNMKETFDLATPEGRIAAFESQQESIAMLTGCVAAAAYTLKVLAATHPDVELLSRAWHAPKDGEIERHLNSEWKSDAFRDGYTKGLASVESIITKAKALRAAEDE